MNLKCTDLIRFFTPRLFSASEVRNGKLAPDLYRHVCAVTNVSPADYIVVEDSAVGVAGGVAAGMTAIGFFGGSHCDIRLTAQLRAAGACAVIPDMRALKSAVIDLRGW